MDHMKRLRSLNLKGKTPDERLEILEYVFQGEDAPQPESIVNQEADNVNEYNDQQNGVFPDDLLTIQEAADTFGYKSHESVKYWIDTYPEIVKPYTIDGVTYVSHADCVNYVQNKGQGPRASEYKTRPTNKVRVEFTSSAYTSAEPLVEFDNKRATCYRVQLSRNNINSLLEKGDIDSIEIGTHILLSVHQIEALKRGQRHIPDFSIFTDGIFMPMTFGLRKLGFENSHNLTTKCGEACTNGEIANRKIGHLRFVAMEDLERWVLSNNLL